MAKVASARQSAIDRLVEATVEMGELGQVLLAAEKLGVSKEAKEAIVKVCLDLGDVGFIVPAAILRGKHGGKLTADEIDCLVVHLPEEHWRAIFDKGELIEVVFGKKTVSGKVNVLVKFFYWAGEGNIDDEQPNDDGQQLRCDEAARGIARELVFLGASEKVIDELVEAEIEDNQLFAALEIAKAGASADVIRELRAVALKEGWIDIVCGAAELLGEKVTLKELRAFPQVQPVKELSQKAAKKDTEDSSVDEGISREVPESVLAGVGSE